MAAKTPKVASGDYVNDPVFGVVPKDAQTHRKLYLESLRNPKAVSPVDGAPQSVQEKLTPKQP